MGVSSVCEVGCCCENKSMKKINAYVCHPDCESFIAELSESTKNTDLWTMSVPGVVILLLPELSGSSKDAELCLAAMRLWAA